VTDGRPPQEEETAPGPRAGNPALALTFAGMRGDAAPAPDLAGMISREQKEEFIRRLFGRDAASYESILETLQHMRTWTEAAPFLHEFFGKQGLDPFSEEVMRFTVIVQERYEGNPRT
ncbi:MAG: hypothetical protein WB626_06665, partial [Bacteroidota bacterium]